MHGSIPIQMSKGVPPWQSYGSGHMDGAQWMELGLYIQEKPSLLGMWMDGIRSLYTRKTISFGNVHLYIIFQGDSHNLIVTTLAC